ILFGMGIRRHVQGRPAHEDGAGGIAAVEEWQSGARTVLLQGSPLKRRISRQLSEPVKERYSPVRGRLEYRSVAVAARYAQFGTAVRARGRQGSTIPATSAECRAW